MVRVKQGRRSAVQSDEMGFTLIEMIAVVAIIGILVAVAIPITLRAVNHSKYSAEEASLTTMQTALSMYAEDNSNSTYPTSSSNLIAALKTYAAGLSANDVWGNPLEYGTTNSGTNYSLYAPGPTGQAGVVASDGNTAAMGNDPGGLNSVS